MNFLPLIYCVISFNLHKLLFWLLHYCRNLTLRECEDETYTPKTGTWESSEIPETLEFNCRGQNTSHWGVFYIIGNLLKFKCRKWARMGHLDIYNTSYGKKKNTKSRGSTCPRCVQVECNTPFTSDLISIGGLSKELWACEVPRVQIGIVLRLLLGNPKTKSHSDVGAVERHREYYMGEGGAFPWIRPVVSLMRLELPVACPNIKGAPESELTNLLVGLMQVWVSKACHSS